MEQFDLNPSDPTQSLQELLDGAQLGLTVNPNTRQEMGRFISSSSPAPRRDTPPTAPPNVRVQTPPPYVPPFAPQLLALIGQIRQELEANLHRLLALNPGRREAIAQYLDRLAGIPPGPTTSSGAADAAGGLRRWLDHPRTPSQESALRMFFEEVALVALGQALLLKAWSDRGLRPIKEEDLSRLNWALSCALKPLLPLDREGWQITRPNLYSWYNPGPSIQRDIWNALESWKITDEDSSFLPGLLRFARQHKPNWPELRSYDSRFFISLWSHLGSFGFDSNPQLGPLKRKRVVFSPTLREGTMVRSGPDSLVWIGLENHPFQLSISEMTLLWWGPTAPPLWAAGTGLEVHARDQLALALGSPKPSLLARITEMEACDLAFVLEERIVRANARSFEAACLREQVDSIPSFRKLRAAGTSLGDLQACVALSKLRPGGLLCWTREEPLSPQDGPEVLNYLLDRGKLLCEWDFSGVEHSLPVTAPLFPKYLYLFSREVDLQQRLGHRPIRIALHGQIRSHIEVPLILEDALQSFHRQIQKRGQWEIHVMPSRSVQKEWGERWPDPTEHDTIRAMDELRSQSEPLASFGTIRPTPEGDPARDHGWTVHPSLKGFWIQAEFTSGARKLTAMPLPSTTRPHSRDVQKGSGFLVLVPSESWVAPLIAWLESDAIHQWLDLHADRRGDRWILTEPVVKYLPVPKVLGQFLGKDPDAETLAQWPTELQTAYQEISFQPRSALEGLTLLPHNEENKRIRAAFFVQCARAHSQLRISQSRLFSVVAPDGKICWRELIEILPQSEHSAVTLSEHVKISGTLPLHLPIGSMERVKIPVPGILLTTESGFNLHIGSYQSKVLDMLWDQLSGLKHPTWNELAQYLRLPRRLELAEETANDILRSHGEQSARLRELFELLSACSKF